MTVTTLTVVLEKRSDAVLISSPDLPGWACSAAGLHAIGACLDSAWTEAAIAAYAARHGAPYDAAHLADANQSPEARWKRGPDGSWTSPQGRRYEAGSERARRRDEIARGEGPPPTRRIVNGDGTPIWRVAHDPADWTPLPGGDWRSPGGHRYRANSAQVTRVIALRLAAGLTVTAPDVEEDSRAG